MNDGNERSGPGQPPANPDDADRTGVITHGASGNQGPPPWQRPGAGGPATPPPGGPAPMPPPGAQPPPGRRPGGLDVGEPEHATSMRGGAYGGGGSTPPHDRPTVYVEPERPRESPVSTDSGGMFDRETLRAENGLGPDSASGGFPRPGATRIRAGRLPRRASLQLKRLDPWSVLKLALVLSVAGFFVWMVAVGVLYLVLGGMGVWDEFNGTYSDLTSVDNDPDGDVVSAGRVFGIAALVGIVNVVLMTALATVGSFIYNMSSDLVGGVEVTLAERD